MILGLTGGIATGKSTVVEFFRQNNIPVICSDTIAREVVKEKGVLKKISQTFGEEMVFQGELDREKMRDYVFKNSERVKKLNEITHPIIIAQIKDEIKNMMQYQILVVDIPLLFEGKYEFLVDKTLLITCSKEIQLQRVQERDGVSEESALNVINRQMSMEEKEKKADFIIENNGTKEELQIKLQNFIFEIKK